MRLSVFISARYFFSRKNPTAINIITFISILGYAVGAWALVVLLSALNGFERVIFDAYKNYYPDLKLSPVLGKTIPIDSGMEQKLRNTPNINHFARVLEENAVIQNGETQVVALVKGVSQEYLEVINADSLVVMGEKSLGDGEMPQSWLGEGLLYKLNIGGDENTVTIMAPRRESVGVAQMDMMEKQVRVSAMIRPGDELSHKLMVIPISLAEEIFERFDEVSAYEVSVKNQNELETTQEELQRKLGASWKVQTRIQQNEAIYKMFNSEKWVTFAMMTFILLLITFNLLGSLSMLVLEKKGDIAMLQNMGARDSIIRRIFYNQGLLVVMVGTFIGIFLGVVAVYLQIRYGFVTTHSTFVSVYPMELRMADLWLILGLCTVLGILGAVVPALKSTQKLNPV